MRDLTPADRLDLLDAARDAITLQTLDNRLIYWNKGAERIYGWRADEVLSRSAEGLMHVDPVAWQTANAELTRYGQWEGELTVTVRDGTTRIVDARWAYVYDEDGKPKSILGITTDITSRKHVENQLLRAQRLDSLGTLASGVAHDLNNMLAPIIVGIDLLKLSCTKESDQRTLATMASSAKRGAELVRRVLAFAQGEESARHPVDVSALAHDVMSILRETFPRNLTCTLICPEDGWYVQGDATQLHQVLMNLAVNSRDAMTDGGLLTIEVSNVMLDEVYVKMNAHARAGAYVSISVTDTGPGISQAVQEKLFEPFFTTKQRGEGTGLGLSTVHSIVRSHGGFVNVYSELGHGARFTVYIPAVLSGSQPMMSDTDASAAPPRGAGETILVVDDEEDILGLVDDTLQKYGYQVILARNGAEGIATFVQRRSEIALVLTDIAMPVMDGTAMITAIKSLAPDMKIIASSGLPLHARQESVLDEGIAAFVSKPYSAAKLLVTVRRVLTDYA